MNIDNRSPHPLNIYDQTGRNLLISIPPSNGTLRVRSASVSAEFLDLGLGMTIPVNNVEYGDLVQVELGTENVIGNGLPEQVQDTYIFMSLLAGTKAKESSPTRNDLLVPGETVRSSDGQIIGIKSFGRP